MGEIVSFFLSIFKSSDASAAEMLFISSPDNKAYIKKKGQTAAILSLAVLFFIILLNFLYIEELSYSDGVIVPKNKIYKLDHLFGGVVKKIFVEDGQAVNEGDFLLLLDDQETTYVLQEAQIEQAFINLEIEYINALFEEKEADLNILFEEKRIERLQHFYQKKIIMNRYRKKKEEFRNKKDLLNIYKALLEKELISKATFLEYRDAIDKFTIEQMDKMYSLQKVSMKNKNTNEQPRSKLRGIRLE